MTRLIVLAAALAMSGSVAPAHPHDEPVIQEPRGPDRPLRPKRDVWV